MLTSVTSGRIPAACIEYEGIPLDQVIAGMGTGELLERALSTTPTQASIPEFDGNEHTLQLLGFRADAMILEGTLEAVEAGTYSAFVTPKPGFWWADNRTRKPKEIKWRIKGTPVEYPVVSTSIPSYTGNTISAPITYDRSAISLSGELSAVDAGEYTVTAKLARGYEWNDGTSERKTYTWEINRKKMAVPTPPAALMYNGAEQQAAFGGVDNTAMQASGTLRATVPGTYKTRFSLLPNHEWMDGSTEDAIVSWEIKPKVIQLPTQTGTPRYNGTSQSPTFDKASEVTMTGKLAAIDAGTYEATAQLAQYCVWPDGTSVSRTVTWSIGNKQIPRVTLATSSYTYTGNTISPSFANVDSAMMKVEGTLAASAIGDHTAVFTPLPNYEWQGGGTDPISITWHVTKIKVTLPAQSGTVRYDGTVKTPIWTGYDTSLMTMSQQTADMINAGTKTARFALKDPTNYEWANGSTDYVDVTWNILNKQIPKVTLSTATYSYTGSAISPSFSNNNTSMVSADGTTSATAVGNYVANFTPLPNHEWQDGSVDILYISWSIGQRSVTVPTQSGSITYDGSAHEPVWSGYDSSIMTVQYITADKTNAGTKTARFTLTNTTNYKWANGSTSSYVDVTWTIQKRSVSVPRPKGTVTYDGTAKTTDWYNYDSNWMTLVQRTTDLTNAGTKTARFTLSDATNCVWSNGTTSNYVDVNWTIAKATGTLSLSSTSGSIFSGRTLEVTATKNSSGSLSATSSNTGVATVAISGTKISIVGVAKGSATITVQAAGDSNYTAASQKTISVSVSNPSLAEATAAEIRSIVRSGQAKNYWKVGDTMPRVLNGTVGGYTFENLHALDVILDFDHNAVLEGYNTMSMGLCWNRRKIGTSDPNYYRYYTLLTNVPKGADYTGYLVAGDDGFYMRPGTEPQVALNGIYYGLVEGGWRDSYMRNTLMPQLLNAISDTDFRNIIANHTVYTSNGAAGGNTTSAEVTATTDKIYLPSVVEITGQTWSDNPYEANFQTQFALLKERESKMSFEGLYALETSSKLATPSGKWVWTRSPAAKKHLTDGDQKYCFCECGGPTIQSIPHTCNTNDAIAPVYTIA